MKNLSFWNKLAGAKGMAVACTAASALSAVLLFVVCSGNNNNTTNPTTTAQYCRFHGDQGSCFQIDPSNSAVADAATCQSGGGFVINSCNTNASTEECNTYSNALGCGSGPTTAQYCRFNADQGSCFQIDPSNPPVASTTVCQNGGGFVINSCNAAVTQSELCAANPNAQGCSSGPNPTAQYCRFHGDQGSCYQIDPSNPAVANATTCQSGGGFVISSCNTPASTAECNAYSNAPGCGGVVTGPCDAGPTTACCAADPSFSGCPTTPQTNSAYCRYEDDPNNCWPIGPTQDVTNDAECRANYGEPVNNCGAVSQLQYCNWGAEGCHPINDPNAVDPESPQGLTFLNNCLQNSDPQQTFNSREACEAWVQTGPEYYCYWETGCAKIQNPDAAKTDCGNPAGSEACPSGMTNKSGCQEYGKLFESQAECNAYTPPAEAYYCQWGGTTGCVKLNNPDAVDPNNVDGLTYKANCEKNSFGLSTSPTCAGITVPTTAYYCDWGTGGCHELKKPDDPCDSSYGACSGTAMEHCRNNATAVITCKGSDRPYDGTCCAH